MPTCTRRSSQILRTIITTAILHTTSVQAGTIPSFTFGGITIKPYATDQLDIGGYPSASPTRPGTDASGARIRNGARVTIRDQIEIGGIWDFGPAPGGPMRLFEGAIAYTGLKHFLFRVGVFKPSFGLESDEAQGDTVFIERSAISTVTRNLAAGIEREAVEAETFGDRYHIAVSATAGTSGPEHDGNQRGIAFRFAGLPLKTGNALLHLGFSGEWVFRPAYDGPNGRSVSFSDTPEGNNGETSHFLNTSAIPARSAGAFGLEAAGQWRRLLVQGEAYTITVNTRPPATTNTLHYYGWYGMAAYTIAGRPRKWKARAGAFSDPTCAANQTVMCNGTGVIEAAARYSQTDLRAPVYSGGNQKIWTAGLNWYPFDIIRLTLQYQHGHITGGKSPERFHAIMSMFQIKF
ncbi:OprO/OprP family phosphate-selective porin [Acetobacter fallax]|uniref:OprO/OprP family phosphate-selective porin n=1 Tax=Acetobacter fallax TaxID=1737473 RepID=UPI001F558DB7|nr:porin [Acetobacter fallax]